MSLSPHLKQRLWDSMAARPSPTRTQTRREQRWFMIAGAAGALLVFLSRGGIRLTGRPAALAAMTSLGTALIAGLGVYVLLTRRDRSMLRRPLAWLLTALALSTVGFVVWKVAWSAQFDLTARWPDRIGYRCLGLGSVCGALPLLAWLAAHRGTEPLTPAITGAAFGAGAGLASAVLVDLWCPVAYLPHLLLGHVLPIALLAGLGALLGGRLLRLPRSLTPAQGNSRT
jgi:hypothetical protein